MCADWYLHGGAATVYLEIFEAQNFQGWPWVPFANKVSRMAT